MNIWKCTRTCNKNIQLLNDVHWEPMETFSIENYDLIRFLSWWTPDCICCELFLSVKQNEQSNIIFELNWIQTCLTLLSSTLTVQYWLKIERIYECEKFRQTLNIAACRYFSSQKTHSKHYPFESQENICVHFTTPWNNH